MANYSDLIKTINDSIKANGNQEITGPVLNAVLQAMVSALGEGYQFMGVATPTTNPGTPDGKVFYIASAEGTYVNFNSIVLSAGIFALIYNNAWEVLTLVSWDDDINNDSINPVQNKVISKGFDNKLDKYIFKELSAIETYNGYINNSTGAKVPSASGTISKKYKINPTLSYVATCYTGTTSPNIHSGIVYVDENDNVVGKQFNSTAPERQIIKDEVLTIPGNAAFCWASGSSVGVMSNVKERVEVSLDGFIALEPLTILENQVFRTDTKQIEEAANGYASKKYIIDSNKDYYIDARLGSAGTDTTMAVYYDENNTYISYELSYVGPGVQIGTKQKLTIPENAKYVLLFGSYGDAAGLSQPQEAFLYEKYSRKQSEGYKMEDGTPYMQYYVSKVSKKILLDYSSSTPIGEEIIDSAWSALFPKSYKDSGEPSQVLFMLHGSSGYVAPGVMSYDTDDWKAWQNAYLDAGFVLIDVNGRGVSSGSDDNSRHFGCPAAVETLKAAFEHIKKCFNVKDKAAIHATSMGGDLAVSYMMTYPQDVLCYGGFGTAILIRSATDIAQGFEHLLPIMADAWGYDDEVAMKNDKYSHFKGFDLFMSANYYDASGNRVEIDWGTMTFGDLMESDYKAVIHFDKPLRIWVGSNDTTNPPDIQQYLVDALKAGGSQATLRIWEGADHGMSSGNEPGVYQEAINFFKRYTK